MSAASPSIAIVGTGALGTYYGARLALAGNDVRFLVRSDPAALRQQGMILHERDAQRHLREPAVFASAAEIGPVDILLVALKTTANAELPRLLPPLLGAETIVVTLQNGLGNEEYIANIVGAGRVLGGLCFIAVTREAPGVLRGFHTPGAMTLGEFGRPAAARTRRLAELLQEAGVRAQAVDDLATARWRKLVWNIPFNGLAIAAGGITTDRLCADPALADEVRGLMREVQAAAAAGGSVIPDAFLQQQFDVTPPMGAYQPSSVIDFLAGRAVEVDAIWGEPLRRASAAGVPVPRWEKLYTEIVRLTR